MFTTEFIKVKNIFQDLKNLRTGTQQDETSAIRALIAQSPEYFYGLAESIIESGYLPLENILVVKNSQTNFTVREGNRRIAILKILLGICDADDFDLPQPILKKIPALSADWIKRNSEVPCLIYKPTETAEVDRIISMVHGKGDKASRLRWNSVARAREARNNGKSQPGLDLLEAYLNKGKNLSKGQIERWIGEYSLSVLDEALPKIVPRISELPVSKFVAKYPSISYRKELEELLHAIGTATVGFPAIRNTNDDIFEKYGFPALPDAKPDPKDDSKSKKKGGAKPDPKSKSKPGSKAFSPTDPKGVAKKLKDFAPVGKDRDKVVELRDEATKLKIAKTPLAFCFLLRSMFEISAVAYCADHGIATYKIKEKDGKKEKPPKSLQKLLEEVADHLIKSKTEENMKKILHGAKSELTKSEGILSVTSLNQLVHNPHFSASPAEVSRVFSNVFPLLLHMNS